jgi:hypothetical protein
MRNTTSQSTGSPPRLRDRNQKALGIPLLRAQPFSFVVFFHQPGVFAFGLLTEISVHQQPQTDGCHDLGRQDQRAENPHFSRRGQTSQVTLCRPNSRLDAPKTETGRLSVLAVSSNLPC